MFVLRATFEACPKQYRWPPYFPPRAGGRDRREEQREAIVTTSKALVTTSVALASNSFLLVNRKKHKHEKTESLACGNFAGRETTQRRRGQVKLYVLSSILFCFRVITCVQCSIDVSYMYVSVTLFSEPVVESNWKEEFNY